MADSTIRHSLDFREVTNSTIANCRINVNPMEGIEIAGSSSPVLRSNHITWPEDPFRFRVGILEIGERSHPVIEGNTFSGGGSRSAIFVGEASEPKILSNKLHAIDGRALTIQDASPTIKGNSISGIEAKAAIICLGESRPHIAENSVVDCAGAGIVVQDQSVAVVKGNHIVGNGQLGIAVIGPARADVDGNTATNNQVGIAFLNAADGTMVNNTVIGNRDQNIALSSEAQSRMDVDQILQRNTIG